MDWWVILIIIFGALIAVFLSGLPVAFAFLFVNVLGTLVWMGGVNGLNLMATSVIRNIGTFTLVAVPMFIFLGEILFQSGLAGLMIGAVSKWIGRIRGSLSLVAVASGTLFAMMSGSSLSAIALLGSTLVPEMRAKGYSKEFSIGPIIGAGGLAIIIPPSILTVVLAALARESVGKMLIAGLIPGLILAILYAIYILVRANLQPRLAPLYAAPRISWGERVATLRYIIPIGVIIFLVLGLFLLGVTTPSEAAAIGALGALILAAVYRRLAWGAFQKAVSETLMVTSMIFLIVMGSTTFSNILAFSGATAQLAQIAVSLAVHPIVVVIVMQLILILLGCFMDSISIMMITVPIFFPVVKTLGFDPIWFGIMMLVNMEMGNISPPFGLFNFVMKGVVPDLSMADIILAGIPFFFLGLLDIVIMLLFPPIVTWLPNLIG